MGIVFTPGRYCGIVTGQGLGESKEKKTPFFAISVEITGRVNPANPTGDLLPAPGGHRTVKLWLTDSTIERTIEDLRRLGFEQSSFKYLDPATPGAWSIIGQEVELYCSQEDDSRTPGEKQEKWGIARDAGLKIERLDQSGLKKLDNLFGKQLKSLAPKQATSTKPAEETVPPSGDVPDDDIPF